MPEIKTKAYVVKPSDNRKWVVIQSPAGKSVDVELRILNYHYDCYPRLIPFGEGHQIPCSYLCCYCGCYVAPKEIERTIPMLEGVKKLLQEDQRKVLEKNNNRFHIPEEHDEKEDLFKICASPEEWKNEDLALDESDPDKALIKKVKGLSQPKNRCVFLMKDGLCATHKYCNDNGLNWVQEKFNICVTFPLDIRPQDNTIAFMNSFDTFTYLPVDCISEDEEKKEKMGMPQIVESMKYAIVDRYGEEWWTALNAFAKDYRAGKIDMAYVYKNVTIPKKKGYKATSQ